MLLLLNIMLLVLLITTLIVLFMKNYFLSRLLGEVCADLGVGIIAGSILSYFLLKNLSFLVFSIIGIFLIIYGTLLIFFAESLLVKSSEY